MSLTTKPPDSFSFCGGFRFVPVCDGDFAERIRFNSSTTSRVGELFSEGSINTRVLIASVDDGLLAIANASRKSTQRVSLWSTPNCKSVYICSMRPKKEVVSRVVYEDTKWVPTILAVIPRDGVDSSDPLVVNEESIFDAFTGEAIAPVDLSAIQQQAKNVQTILHVPEWGNKAELFVGGRCDLRSRRDLLENNTSFLCGYDVERGRIFGEFKRSQQRASGSLQKAMEIHTLAASPMRKLLYSTHSDQTLRVWSRDNFDQRVGLKKLACDCVCTHCAEDQNRLLLGTGEGTIRVCDTRNLRSQVREFQVARKRPRVSGPQYLAIHGLARVGESGFFVSGSENHSLSTWNPETGKVKKSVFLPGSIYGVCSLPDDAIQGKEAADELERAVFLLKKAVETREVRIVVIELILTGWKSLFVHSLA